MLESINQTVTKFESCFNWIDSLFSNKIKHNYRQKHKTSVKSEQMDRNDPFLLDNEQNRQEQKRMENKLDENIELIKKCNNDFMCFIIDCLCINHSIYKTKINVEFLQETVSNNAANLSENYVVQLVNQFSSNLPSKKMIKIAKQIGYSSTTKANNTATKPTKRTEKNELSTKTSLKMEKMIQYLLKNGKTRELTVLSDQNCGFLLIDKYLATILGCIKFRIVEKDDNNNRSNISYLRNLISFDLGHLNQFELSLSDLVALLLEICDESMQQTVTRLISIFCLFFFFCVGLLFCLFTRFDASHTELAFSCFWVVCNVGVVTIETGAVLSGSLFLVF